MRKHIKNDSYYNRKKKWNREMVLGVGENNKVNNYKIVFGKCIQIDNKKGAK